LIHDEPWALGGCATPYSDAVDRFTWGIVVGAVLLVAVGLASVALLQRPAPAPNLATPDGVVRAYVIALDTGHPEQAWDLLTSGARSGTTRDEFIRRATAEGRPRYGRVAIEDTTVEGNTARVELSRTFGSGGGLFADGGGSQRITVRLEREDGAWRIAVPPDSYLLDRPFPAPAVSAPTAAPTTAPTVAPAAGSTVTPGPR
jgi:hypothetical protein